MTDRLLADFYSMVSESILLKVGRVHQMLTLSCTHLLFVYDEHRTSAIVITKLAHLFCNIKTFSCLSSHLQWISRTWHVECKPYRVSDTRSMELWIYTFKSIVEVFYRWMPPVFYRWMPPVFYRWMSPVFYRWMPPVFYRWMPPVFYRWMPPVFYRWMPPVFYHWMPPVFYRWMPPVFYRWMPPVFYRWMPSD